MRLGGAPARFALEAALVRLLMRHDLAAALDLAEALLLCPSR